jgi:hypothetical protein
VISISFPAFVCYYDIFQAIGSSDLSSQSRLPYSMEYYACNISLVLARIFVR